MKHSINEIIAICHQFYPKGISDDDPVYKDTQENRAIVAIRQRAGEWGSPWRQLVSVRLRERFPDRVENRSPHLPLGHLDGGGTGHIHVQKVGPESYGNHLEFHVSLLAPYYFFYSCRLQDSTGRFEDHLNLLPSEQPYASALVEEIEATFPGYEPLPIEVGSVIVPDIVVNVHRWGEVRVYHALFTDNILAPPGL